jgi:hypothetical protein
LENDPVDHEVIEIGNKYAALDNLLMRPYGKYRRGIGKLINIALSVPFKVLYKWYPKKDNAPLGVAVIIIKK